MAAVDVPIPLSFATTSFVLGVLIAVLAVIKNLSDNYSTFWSYVGVVLAILVAVGAWMEVQEAGGIEHLKTDAASLGGSGGGGAAAAAAAPAAPAPAAPAPAPPPSAPPAEASAPAEGTESAPSPAPDEGGGAAEEASDAAEQAADPTSDEPSSEQGA
jgi:hypothetical protein